MRMREPEPTFQYMYNYTYGGFNLPYPVELYNAEAPIQSHIQWGREVARDDPIAIRILKRLGLESAGTMRLATFPEKYRGFIELDEYDGAEKPWVNYHRYITEKLASMDFSEVIDLRALRELQRDARCYRGERDRYSREYVDTQPGGW